MSGADFASFQFPVDDEEEEEQPEKHVPTFNRQPSSSALKKASRPNSGEGVGRKKTPAFKERYIISIAW